ncbi:MAG: hypothetical protein ONB48_02480 [candidate division KSB1 bacterium]|nr:hypothetical protein [candidate division KSB1 bacterium]MDZ7284519.1 hypothetical protein [candidate division KSB1 bacterium]MDZ7297085.1 hypothetical protein [candidate division KSB1 bacterium]MDZ7306125.1 hypothetical protein [candidate division KSB1 bacterium]MDZ7347952.1 hypothetical protein [candidate division KSB1 bacterium]
MMTLLTALSLLGLAALSVFYFLKSRRLKPFLLQIVVLALCFAALHALFDFPARAPAARGAEDVYFVIVLYLCMLLGMAANYAHNRFLLPKEQRPKFDPGLFFAPIFASPIVFIPLLAALQNVGVDLARLTVPKMMVFFVAFENGFFWKEYFDHRRQEKQAGEK